MRPRLTCLVLITVACLSLRVLAQEKPAADAEAEKLFKQFDKDSDGTVTGAEVPENRRPLFYRLIRFGDKDDSGALTMEEFTAAFAEQKPRNKDGDAEATDKRPRRPNPDQLFTRLDANGDGKIEESEVPAGRRDLIDRLGKKADKNNDGSIDREEFAAVASELRGAGTVGPKPEQMFKSLDADGDGKLTIDEVPSERRRLFQRISAQADKNADKVLSEAEFVAGFKAARGAVGQQRPGADAAVDPQQAAERLKRLDRNGDGKISRDEFDRPNVRRFEQLDTNNDGTVDEAEIKAQIESLNKKLEGRENNKQEDKSTPPRQNPVRNK